MGETIGLDIARLGAQGDGIADTPSGPVFVPYTLPGERVQADSRGERGRLIAVITPSPDRTAPVCRHFTHCGGCAVQHMRMPPYLAWKRDMVAAAFAARGIEAPVAHVASVGLGARRRATFSARRTGRGVMLGFHEVKGHDIVDLVECPVTASAIVRAMPGLRRLIEPLSSRRAPARLVVTLAANGLDVAIEDVPGELSADVRERLAGEATACQLARLTLSAIRSIRPPCRPYALGGQRRAAGALVPAGGAGGGSRDGAPRDRGRGRIQARRRPLLRWNFTFPLAQRSPCWQSMATSWRWPRCRMLPSARQA
jgi:23S rRNA (uracil1939-C5)-methyltransferase